MITVPKYFVDFNFHDMMVPSIFADKWGLLSLASVGWMLTKERVYEPVGRKS